MENEDEVERNKPLKEKRAIKLSFLIILISYFLLDGILAHIRIPKAKTISIHETIHSRVCISLGGKKYLIAYHTAIQHKKLLYVSGFMIKRVVK